MAIFNRAKWILRVTIYSNLSLTAPTKWHQKFYKCKLYSHIITKNVRQKMSKLWNTEWNNEHTMVNTRQSKLMLINWTEFPFEFKTKIAWEEKTYFSIANASVQYFFDWEFFFGGITFRHGYCLVFTVFHHTNNNFYNTIRVNLNISVKTRGWEIGKKSVN